MKNKIVSIITILVLLIAVVITIKMGKIELFDNSGNNIVSEEDTTDKEGKKTRFEDYTTDKMELINVGDEAIYERIKKTNGMNNNVRYQFKYIDYSISKNKPEGIEINYYKNAEEAVDDNGNFIDDTYYVTVTYEVTNKKEDDWNNSLLYPQNFTIGYYEDKFVAVGEPRGYLHNEAMDIRANVKLEKDEKTTITACYCVKKELLDKKNIVVKMNVVESKEAIRIPFLVVNTEGVTE